MKSVTSYCSDSSWFINSGSTGSVIIIVWHWRCLNVIMNNEKDQPILQTARRSLYDVITATTGSDVKWHHKMRFPPPPFSLYFSCSRFEKKDGRTAGWLTYRSAQECIGGSFWVFLLNHNRQPQVTILRAVYTDYESSLYLTGVTDSLEIRRSCWNTRMCAPCQSIMITTT